MIQHPYSGPTYFCILFPPAIKPKNFVCRNTENMSDRMQILHTFDTSDRIRKRRLLAFPIGRRKKYAVKSGNSILKQLHGNLLIRILPGYFCESVVTCSVIHLMRIRQKAHHHDFRPHTATPH